MDLPPIRCKCKVSRCAQCGLCSRCGCDHDGVSVQAKLSRKRGGQLRRSSIRNQPVKRKRAAAIAARTSMEYSHDDGEEGVEEMVYPLHFAGVNMMDLRRTFAIPASVTSHFPPSHLRSSDAGPDDADLDELSQQQLSSMVNVLNLCVQRLCEIIYPRDPSSFSKKAMRVVAERAGVCVQRNAANVLSSLVNTVDLLGPYSLQRRVCFAMLAGNMTHKQLLQLMNDELAKRQQAEGGGSNGDEGDDSSRKATLNRDRFTKGRRDFERLAAGREIVAVKHSRTRFSKASVTAAIKFILQSDNIVTLSWGTRKLRLNGQDVNFPCIMRRRRRSHIVASYVRSVSSLPSSNKLGTNSMFKLVNLLTTKELKRKSAVDYVYGILVLDATALLRKMIRNEIGDEVLRRDLLKMTVGLEKFLKVSNVVVVMMVGASVLMMKL